MSIYRLALVLLLSGACAAPALARGGGGCVAEGTLIATPTGDVPVEQLQPGAAVWTISSGRLVPGTVQACLTVEPREFVVLRAAGHLLKVTPEHPVQVAPGTFRTAGSLKTGDNVWLNDGSDLLGPQRLNQVERETAKAVPISGAGGGGPVRAYNLLVTPGAVYLANHVAVHNKGCFLPDTPIVLGDGNLKPISQIKPEDEVLAFTADEQVVRTRVRNIMTAQVSEYCVVTTDTAVLSVTPDHPFYVGNQTFKTIEALHVGDSLVAYDGLGLSRQRITAINRITQSATVYNLQTDDPHTFFAHGVAVHNKGGGCFPAGTRIATERGLVPIETLSPGAQVLSVDPSGHWIGVQVLGLVAARAALLIVETDTGTLHTTWDHPVRLADGSFAAAGRLRPGDRIATWSASKLGSAEITALRFQPDEQEVFNLSVEDPHTFVADGFVVHNKGGGGGFSGGHYSGFHSYGSGWSSTQPGDWPGWAPAVITTVIFGGFLGCLGIYRLVKGGLPGLSGGSGASDGEELDVILPDSRIAAKAAATEALLGRVAQKDPALTPAILNQMVQATFTKLQECWQARNYSPMRLLLMPDLYEEHVRLLQAMVRQHEINRIENLRIERVRFVHLRYPPQPEQRQFTALITAMARDYYVDDRNDKFLRGDGAPARFQEVWTFHWLGNGWLLSEIEQTAESDVLSEENLAPGLTGPAPNGGESAHAPPSDAANTPAIEMVANTREGKVNALLARLALCDPLWDRDAMLRTVRDVFSKVMAARQAGDPNQLPSGAMFPDCSAKIVQELVGRQQSGQSIEFRNLCLRQAQIVLVRNLSDPSDDEFMARLVAHAQRVVLRGGQRVSGDADVRRFEDYWVFGRHDGQWKLKDVLPPSQGSALMAQMDGSDEFQASVGDRDS